MPVIDADGLFGGDRFDLMSDEARLYWPHFWCASSTVGRIELNYRKVCAVAFGRWRKRITEDKFWALIAEYRDSYLLYVYEVEGTIWGAWDTSEKYLPRHKMAADLRSPAPTAKDFLDWKKEYSDKKAAKSNVPTNFVNRAQSGADVHGNVRGIGIGVGGGIGKTSVAKDATDVRSISEADPIAEWFNREFWPLYPRHTAKKVGLDAARKLKTEDERSVALTGLRAQLPEMKARDPSKIPHASTWLNGRRWEDEASPLFALSGPPRIIVPNIDPYAKYDPNSPLYEPQPHAD